MLPFVFWQYKLLKFDANQTFCFCLDSGSAQQHFSANSPRRPPERSISLRTWVVVIPSEGSMAGWVRPRGTAARASRKTTAVVKMKAERSSWRLDPHVSFIIQIFFPGSLLRKVSETEWKIIEGGVHLNKLVASQLPYPMGGKKDPDDSPQSCATHADAGMSGKGYILGQRPPLPLLSVSRRIRACKRTYSWCVGDSHFLFFFYTWVIGIWLIHLKAY